MSNDETNSKSALVDEPVTTTAEGEGVVAEPLDELEQLRSQLAEGKEQLLRAHAEMQNVRRRAELDVEKAHKFALERFAKELLPVVDSLEKSVESCQQQTGAEDERVAAIRQGVDMTLSLMVGSLRKFNVVQLDPLGAPFDPQQHEALSMVPAPHAEPNSVISVVQKGYTLSDRLLRPAMVVVARPQESVKVDERA